MEWLEVSVQVGSEAAEAVAEVLTRFAPHGVAVEAGAEGICAGPVTVCAYLPANEHLPRTQRLVEEALWHLGQIIPIPEPAFRPVAETDWAELWKEHLRVLHVGRRVVIRPSWLPYAPREHEVVVILDPGMAFGTGLHPTTQMCLMALEEHVHPGMRVLDLGTGSGILAIAGAKLGAGSVLALDSDLQAVAVARSNARRNGVADRVQVREGSLAQADGPFDLVMVNILAKVIVQMTEQGLEKRLAPQGLAVVAGLVADQEEEVTEALLRAGLAVVGRRQVEEWVALEVRRAGFS
ncbi:MAG TPA: 50S ribosomal protein L11 methyltransferase [Chloroflexi bacterium]|nr:50S ribosomal protein L11 methyltransferase [Chloroflexota bacterium]